jgi:hypothetical protein
VPAGDVRLISLCAGQGRDDVRRPAGRDGGCPARPVRARRAGPVDQAPQSARPDPAIRSWFAEAGFGEEAFDISGDGFMSVGAHRLTGEPAALVPGQRLFTFAPWT